jgi:uncharacterized protein (DUF983 family)
MSDPVRTRVSYVRAGLACRCPRCGKGKLFKGYLTVAEACSECGLDLSRHETADGPAVFVVLFVGFLVVAGALIVEVNYRPPYWLHAVIWLPLIVGTSLGLLRPLKGLFFAQAWRHIETEDQDTNIE